MASGKYIYLILLASCFIFPLAFSFGKRLAFYKNWGKVLVATIVPAAFFIALDVWFTSRGVFSFNDSYIIGVRFFNLPIEEWLFYIVIPYCSIFVYELLNSYFPKADYNQQLFWGLIFLCLIFIGLAIVSFNRNYTFWSYTFDAIFLAILLLNIWFLEHITHFLLTFAICFLPMAFVYGMLTALPVVEYNAMQISGFKIFSIPVEDFSYFFLLLMMNMLIFVRMKRVKE